MANLTLAVSEGTLTDHPMELHEASVTMERWRYLVSCCQYHDAHSFGVALMNSEAEFSDCYFFRNGEDGCNVGGALAQVRLQNCRLGRDLILNESCCDGNCTEYQTIIPLAYMSTMGHL
eukprot:764589-Hanusia_phi.AAC.4